MKEYGELIKEFKADVKSDIEKQQQEIGAAVKSQLEDFSEKEANREKEREEEETRKAAEALEREEQARKMRETIA